MSTPAIPTGYRRLRVGQKRPKGYRYPSSGGRSWLNGLFPGGEKLTKRVIEELGPYIAPVRRRKGGKKGRAK